MEKIYMNENKNKKHSVINTSVVLSFVVSLFAIFSLAVFGIVNNQGTAVSYAAIPYNTESFTFIEEDNGTGAPVFVTTGTYNVPVYQAINIKKAGETEIVPGPESIFCIEHNNENVGGEYKSDGDIENDYGLIELLSKSFANNKPVTDATGNVQKYVETWVTQTAIWVYLSEKNNNAAPHKITEEEMNAITTAKTLTVNKIDVSSYTAPQGKTLYELYVRPLVDAAKNASNTYKLDAQYNGKISLTSDKKYYETTAIKVVTNTVADLEDFDIELSGIEGAEVIDENGKKMESIKGIKPGTNFKVRVPADKVTEKIQKLNIDVIGHFNSKIGKYFIATSGDKQKVVSVTPTTIRVRDKIEAEFVGTPDTGMNTAQTIYFIGLIVLLCGVGIVYANAKPVQVK